ncbi:MAG: hypothetical protein AAF915_27065 [Cyanobacteria bacterium P01_D01_bin.50]
MHLLNKFPCVIANLILGASNPNENYTEEPLITQLQSLVKDKKWKDWLVVFGSILGTSAPAAKSVTNGKYDQVDINALKEAYNYTLVQKGGFGDLNFAHQHAKVVAKEYKSQVDFIQQPEFMGVGITLERVLHPIRANPEKLRTRFLELIGLPEKFKNELRKSNPIANPAELFTYAKNKIQEIIPTISEKEVEELIKTDIQLLTNWVKEDSRRALVLKDSAFWQKNNYPFIPTIIEKYLIAKGEQKLLTEEKSFAGIDLEKFAQLKPYLRDFIGINKADDNELKSISNLTPIEIALWNSQRDFVKNLIEIDENTKYKKLEAELDKFKTPFYNQLKQLIKRYLISKNAEELLSVLNYEDSSVFTIDDLTFGLEICLDHLVKRLKNSRELPKIDIQLIPSCGMSIVKDAIVAQKDGYVFNCDGASNGFNDNQYVGSDKSANNSSHSNLIKITKDTPPPLTYSFTNMPATYIVNPPASWAAKSIDIDDLYAEGAGKLHIYPTQLISEKLAEGKSIIPQSLSSFSFAYSSEKSVLINGMKVLFDKSVSVYPVNLMEKDK